MPYFHATLELRSGLGTPLAADTLWGHIAWGIRYTEGESALLQWLDAHDSASPPLILSDPFPHGYWPRPKLPASPRPETAPTREQAQHHKLAQRQAWIPHAVWASIADDLSPEALSASLRNGPVPPAPTTVSMVHAAINRWTGGTAHESGGGLYTSEQTYYDGPVLFDVWGQSSEPITIVKHWFEHGLAGGYGRDASSGLGHLSIVEVRELSEWCNVPQANAAVALGAFIPAPHDPVQGWFSGEIKSGRVGGDFAIGALPNDSALRQKRLIRRITTGSVLYCPEGPASWIGRNLRGVHRDLDSIRQYGFAITLPVRLAASLVQSFLPREDASQ